MAAIKGLKFKSELGWTCRVTSGVSKVGAVQVVWLDGPLKGRPAAPLFNSLTRIV